MSKYWLKKMTGNHLKDSKMHCKWADKYKQIDIFKHK